MSKYASINEQLKQYPCPFCKGANPIVWEYELNGANWITIRCKDCGAMGPQYFIATNEAVNLAVMQWKQAHDSTV